MAMHKFLESKAGQYMTRELKTVAPDLRLGELERLFAAHDYNAFPVVDGGRMLGVVTKLDFLKAFVFTTRQIVPHYDALMGRTVGEVMTREVASVPVDAPLTKVLEAMIERKARSFPVLDTQGALVGIIAREDLMRALRESVGRQA